MARSVLDLAKMADLLRQKGVVLKVLDQSIDTGIPEGKLMFSLLASFAEFEKIFALSVSRMPSPKRRRRPMRVVRTLAMKLRKCPC